MTTALKVSVVQLNSGGDIGANLDKVMQLVSMCVEDDRPDIIMLPEYFSFLSGNPEAMLQAAEKLGDNTIPEFLGTLASEKGVTIHAGSSIVKNEGKLFNQSFVYNQHGEQIATYQDVYLPSEKDST